MNCEFVAMLDCTSGNESVGEMWTETAIFPATTSVEEVMRWASSRASKTPIDQTPLRLNLNVRLQVAQRP